MNIIINKEGYIIPKIDKYNDIINKAKKELEVQPYITFNLPNIKPNKFKVYKEYDNYIVIPKFYGIKYIGKPDEIHNYKGKSININFTGTLRLSQEEIINNILPYINNNKGGVLCLPCAAGKTVLSLYLIRDVLIRLLNV